MVEKRSFERKMKKKLIWKGSGNANCMHILFPNAMTTTTVYKPKQWHKSQREERTTETHGEKRLATSNQTKHPFSFAWTPEQLVLNCLFFFFCFFGGAQAFSYNSSTHSFDWIITNAQHTKCFWMFQHTRLFNESRSDTLSHIPSHLLHEWSTRTYGWFEYKEISMLCVEKAHCLGIEWFDSFFYRSNNEWRRNERGKNKSTMKRNKIYNKYQ